MGCSLSWECTSRFPTNVYGRSRQLWCWVVDLSPGVLEKNDSIEPVPKWGFQMCSVALGTLITVDGCKIRSTTNFGWLNPYKWDIYQPKGSEKLNEFQWLFRSIRFIAVFYLSRRSRDCWWIVGLIWPGKNLHVCLSKSTKVWLKYTEVGSRKNPCAIWCQVPNEIGHVIR